jgi:hypothetical protein
VQWPQRLALHHRDLGLAGRGAGAVGGDEAERVEARIQGLDATEQRVGDLDRRQLLVTNCSGDLESGSPGEIVVDQGKILRTQRIVSSGS